MTPKQIKALRKRLGMSQTKLAVAFGVTVPTVQNWENGRAKPCGPNKNKLAAIATGKALS